MTNLVDVALDYAARGFNVIPIRPDARKRPALAHWKPYQDQRVSDDELRRWFDRRSCGIAVICGRVSDGLVVIDIDDVALAQLFLAANPGVLESTLCARTGGGKLHIYVRVPSPPRKFSLLKQDPSVPIDVQGEGGYAVMPPSLHASGRRYEWMPGCGQEPICVLSFNVWFQNALGRAGISWVPQRARFARVGPVPIDNEGAGRVITLLRDRTGEQGQPRGNELWFRCPFHPDEVASLSANIERPVWHCFGCDEGGGIRRLEELSRGR